MKRTEILKAISLVDKSVLAELIDTKNLAIIKYLILQSTALNRLDSLKFILSLNETNLNYINNRPFINATNHQNYEMLELLINYDSIIPNSDILSTIIYLINNNKGKAAYRLFLKTKNREQMQIIPEDLFRELYE